MEEKRKDFFWTSYVDLMTALFAVVLVLFVLSYYNLNKKKKELEDLVKIKTEEAEILNKVKSNFKIFETEPEIFYFDTIYNRIQLKFQINFKTGYQFYQINEQDINGNYSQTKSNLDALGNKIKSIIDTFKRQKDTDPAMKDISYLMVISGSASRLKGDDEYQSSILSYNRALFLYKYWKENLGIDFDSPQYHEIIELQISGVGFGGIGRFNIPYNLNNVNEEKKNQRFVISIAPKIGK